MTPQPQERDAAINHREVILDAILMPDATREGAAVRNAGRAALDDLLAENEKLCEALAFALDCKGPSAGLVSRDGGYPAICTACAATGAAALRGDKEAEPNG